jgi:hypothetical protein
MSAHGWLELIGSVAGIAGVIARGSFVGNGEKRVLGECRGLLYYFVRTA